ncbi:unnamed protein product, partial [Amoebophrya sp. A25]
GGRGGSNIKPAPTEQPYSPGSSAVASEKKKRVSKSVISSMSRAYAEHTRTSDHGLLELSDTWDDEKLRPTTLNFHDSESKKAEDRTVLSIVRISEELDAFPASTTFDAQTNKIQQQTVFGSSSSQEDEINSSCCVVHDGGRLTHDLGEASAKALLLSGRTQDSRKE